jgi:nicotinate-nucleotide adenylyltransferase
MQPRLCLFGGTFDPVHIAHLSIAEEALRHFQLDRILFIPAGNPPHKNGGVSPFEDRFRMVQIACECDPRFEASRLEEGAERSYTIETVRRVRKQMGAEEKLFFLIGGDAFDELETWKDWQDLIKLTDFIVVARPGREYRVPEGARVHRLDNLLLPVSSSEIRARLAAGKATPELPAAVRRFIEKRGLYGARPRGVSADRIRS